MSWTEFFPFLDDNAVDSYESQASDIEKADLKSLFRVAEVINPKEARHVVAASLFWKPISAVGVELPPLTLGLDLQKEVDQGLTRFANPWEHYVAPLLKGIKSLSHERPDVAFRIYLANDLEHLVPDLTEAGGEVYLMESSSLALQPGTIWRFLALGHDGLTTITDSDRANDVLHDVERTELMADGGLAFWRVAYHCGAEQKNMTTYRPVLACQFGSTKSYPTEELMMAFIWHSRRGTLGNTVKINEHEKAVFGTEWPGFGFDEWFLQAGLFPRIAFEGILSFVSWNNPHLGHWFALDIEYCTWANPLSEIVYYKEEEEKASYSSPTGQEDQTCCGSK
jgi:hypothetical protein